jgi:hypothetical protein
MQFAVSSSRFPASFPVDTVHVFHPNQLHSSHVTSLLLNHSRSTRFRHLVARHLQPKSSTTTVCFLYQLFILQLTTSSASSTGCFSPCFRRQASPARLRPPPWFRFKDLRVCIFQYASSILAGLFLGSNRSGVLFPAYTKAFLL